MVAKAAREALWVRREVARTLWHELNIKNDEVLTLTAAQILSVGGALLDAGPRRGLSSDGVFLRESEATKALERFIGLVRTARSANAEATRWSR